MRRSTVLVMLFLGCSLLTACGEEDGGGDGEGMGDAGDGDGDGDGDGNCGDPNDPAQLCVDTINMYRATLNLPPYARWCEAEVCSDGEAQMDSVSGQAHGAFGMCGESAQNECPGWPGPPASMIEDCLALMWAEGPGEDFQKHGHYINMSSTNYTKVACGYHSTGDGGVWAVQNFR